MDQETAKKLLADERTRIEESIARANREEPLEGDAHIEPGHRGSESLMQSELDAGLAQSDEQQLAALERAETRLSEGTYGKSVESGDPIPDGRLKANPLADRTVEEERSGGRL